MGKTTTGTAETYHLLLFVAGDTPLSHRAVEGVNQLREHHLNGPSDLVVVDVLSQFELAAQHAIFATPTLLITAPITTRVLGDFSDPKAVLAALDLPPR